MVAHIRAEVLKKSFAAISLKPLAFKLWLTLLEYYTILFHWRARNKNRPKFRGDLFRRREDNDYPVFWWGIDKIVSYKVMTQYECLEGIGGKSCIEMERRRIIPWFFHPSCSNQFYYLWRGWFVVIVDEGSSSSESKKRFIQEVGDGGRRGNVTVQEVQRVD